MAAALLRVARRGERMVTEVTRWLADAAVMLEPAGALAGHEDAEGPPIYAVVSARPTLGG